ncbi:metal ABC transporter ATP-binding protein [Clostridium chauvoei]|uniref:Metal ABC transporter ATP-binding protein n=2 Tax=Clostridium chauvoei TaxID=46867 RepID=A0ABD4RI16_9CLOT|nr:metal ABC transporter ATP-binding protein [Clostridium chauvoei]ATD56192.1 metal ABC transporter ATP-binding protein [Clostridium chauvoei]ATD58710.1 metal ABC transporter ATP-binding protein [Clostridium chauvoei]MBX7280993.1 metal ABC transporter ATP-binding protein [Clostridium chauvoei]MBX7283505.1 metal ABC transporter ATP-binding protein [Clostridium chauvoei]MBX7286082.1 metal ABC transporter ATP-binding protein [Clostridium chauvoei]
MININNLCFSYTNKTPYLLNNVNLSIPKGAYISVVGENGSCKTTLIKLILGLLSPTSGSIEIETNSIGYVPQRLDSFNSQFPITVTEVLECHVKTLKNKNSNITSALKQVNMYDFKNSLLGNLSGGQQQRILIARSLMGNPEVIILDEPSTGVDENNQKEIYGILNKLNQFDHKTIISIEHNINIALKYSTHILKVHNGTVKLYTVKDYIKFRNEDSFLDDAI